MNLVDLLADEATDVPGLYTPAEFWSAYERDRPRRVAFDTESPTYKWHLPHADPFALQFSWGRERTYYVPTHLDDGSIDPEAAQVLYKFLAATPEVVGWNTLYDLHVAKRLLDMFGLPLLPRRIDDGMLLHAVLDEHAHHGLKEVSTSLGISFDADHADLHKQRITAWIEAQIEQTGREPGYDEVPLRLMVPYARGDAYITLETFAYLNGQLLEETDSRPGRRDLTDIYELELKLAWVLFAAEERGMRIDLDFCAERCGELAGLVESLKQKLRSQLQWDINPLSSDHVAKALHDLLGQEEYERVIWVNPKTGKVNLPEWKMTELAEQEDIAPLVKDVLLYRTSSKMLTSYFEALMRECKSDDRAQAIVRCHFKQVGPRTGRMSVTEPPLQTLPREKGNVRGAFIARAGHKLVFADYKGQELRVLGHYLAAIGDESIQRVYLDPEADLHMETAKAIFRVDAPTKEQRQLAKNVNFAIVYGAGSRKVGSMLGVEEHEGKVALDRVYARFPGLRQLKRMTSKAVEQRGYVVTAFGRRHREHNRRMGYKALNSLIQGTAADITKAAMVELDRRLFEKKMRTLILLSVHDEIISEAPDEEVEQVEQLTRAAMGAFPELLVPLDVDVSVAERWSEK